VLWSGTSITRSCVKAEAADAFEHGGRNTAASAFRAYLDEAVFFRRLRDKAPLLFSGEKSMWKNARTFLLIAAWIRKQEGEMAAPLGLCRSSPSLVTASRDMLRQARGRSAAIVAA
jgi:hypothetical protein